MRQLGRAALLLVSLICTTPALACSCMGWNPKVIAKETALIFVGEVTEVGTKEVIAERWGTYDVKAVSISVRVLERLKGKPPKNGRLMQLAPRVMCTADLTKGEKAIFMLSSPSDLVGICNLAPAEEDYLKQLRSALRAK